jgi:hypothetical protein
MERLIDPVIADLQCEHDHASRSGRPWDRWRVLFNGYLAFWRVLVLHVPIVWTGRVVRAFVGHEHAARGRAFGAGTITIVALNAAFLAPPLQVLPRHDGHWAWWILLNLPQSLPLSIPLTLLVGVLCGLRGRTATTRIRGAVLVIGLTGSLASFGTIKWLIPAADYAFRLTIAGRPVVKGLGEAPLESLRERAFAIKSSGRLDRAGGLLFSYHARWALVGAALTFALFGLGVTALRVGGAVTAWIAAIASIVYVTYFFQLRLVPPSVFSNEPVALVLAWLPNLWLILTSMLFLSIRHENLDI